MFRLIESSSGQLLNHVKVFLTFRGPCIVSICLLIRLQSYLTERIAFSAEINIISHTIVILTYL